MARRARRGVHGQVVESIARRILRGEVGEGETLNLSALRVELEVSLTALREALKVLSGKGIVDARQRRGTYVRPRTDWNVLDPEVIDWQLAEQHGKQVLDNLHELRMIVEPAAARLAAERATDQNITNMDAAIAAMADASGLATLTESDLMFHRHLMAASRNYLMNQLGVVVEAEVAERIRSTICRHADEAVRAHYAVLVAIRQRDSARAEAAVRTLIQDLEAG